MLEAAIVLPVLLALVLFLFDLGLGVQRYHQVCEAARQGARFAIVHGQLAPPALPQWGPGTISVPATAVGVPIVDHLRRGDLNQLLDPGYLSGLSLPNTQITVEWSDGSTEIGKRVRVTVTTPYQPIVTLGQAYTLTASSTMQIAH
ncbi:MAG: pilus assembly protein [Planctomycetes bacterium]|nr:pilus assembly protein [Planctomycetota bacterium]